MAPVFAILTSPLITTAAAAFDPLPTMMFPLFKEEPIGDTPEIVVLDALIILPFASTEIEGTDVALP